MSKKIAGAKPDKPTAKQGATDLSDEQLAKAQGGDPWGNFQAAANTAKKVLNAVNDANNAIIRNIK